MQWYPKVMHKDYTVGLNVTATGVDDPDQLCAARSATIPAIVALRSIKLVDQQSMQSDPEKRKKPVWEIKRRLAEDGARPVIFYPRGGTCRQPYVKGADHHGQQHLQWVAHGRRLARQVAVLVLLAVAGC